MNRPSRRIAALLLGLALVLAACGGGAADDTTDNATGQDAGDGATAAGQEITLEFPSWQAETEGFGDWWSELIAAYEEEHPNVTIDHYPIAFDNYVDQLITRFSAGDPPEIVHLPSRNFPEFAAQEWLVSLDDRLADTDVLDTWSPLQEEMVWQDQHQGVLLLGYGYVLYYNEQLLEDAGVEVPTTPQDFLAAAEAITTGDTYGFGATTVQNPDNYTEASMFVVGNEGFWTDGSGTPTVTDPAVVEALDWFDQALEFAPEGIQSQQRLELFNNGQIGMLLDGPFLLPELDAAPDDVRENLKVAAPPFPQVPGGVSNSIHMPSGLDDATADAVWDFIELATTPEWQQRYTELVQVPAPREGSVTDAALEETPQLALFGQTTEEAVSIFPEEPELKSNFGELEQAVSELVVTLISDDSATPETVAEQLQQRLPEIAEQ